MITSNEEVASKLGISLKVVEIKKLRAHENVEETRLKSLIEEIRKDGCIKKAIAADLNTSVIIDGHHRTKALTELGCKNIPVVLVDYFSPILKVVSWESNSVFPKEIVIKSGLSGNLLPPRTTKHLVIVNGTYFHISDFEPEVNVPLQELI
jgi:hypothetical protein